jgi:hypothetical protein
VGGITLLNIHLYLNMKLGHISCTWLTADDATTATTAAQDEAVVVAAAATTAATPAATAGTAAAWADGLTSSDGDQSAKPLLPTTTAILVQVSVMLTAVTGQSVLPVEASITNHSLSQSHMRI